MKSLNRYNDYLLEGMWEKLKRISFIRNEAEEDILPFSWEDFPKGTRKAAILEFFDKNYSKGLHGLSVEHTGISFLW